MNNRFLKIAQLMNDENKDKWAKIYEKCNSGELSTDNIDELKLIIEKAKKINQASTKIIDLQKEIKSFDESDILKLKEYLLDPKKAEQTKESKDISANISKNSGFFGNLWSGTKSLFRGLGKIIFVGTGIYSIFELKSDIDSMNDAVEIIKHEFSDLTSGNSNILFDSKYISRLIVLNYNNPDKIERILLLNNVAKIYKANFVDSVINTIFALELLIETLLYIFSGGTAIPIVEGIKVILSGLKSLCFYSILGTIGKTVGDITTPEKMDHLFGTIRIGTADYDRNNERIKLLAKTKMSMPVAKNLMIS